MSYIINHSRDQYVDLYNYYWNIYLNYRSHMLFGLNSDIDYIYIYVYIVKSKCKTSISMLRICGTETKYLQNVGTFNHSKEFNEYLNFVLKHGVSMKCYLFFHIRPMFSSFLCFNLINRLRKIIEISSCVLSPVLVPGPGGSDCWKNRCDWPH